MAGVLDVAVAVVVAVAVTMGLIKAMIMTLAVKVSSF